MFSSELKKQISTEVQRILKQTNHPELPKGEIHFLLHVDGAAGWSWTNIRNNESKHLEPPLNMVGNQSVE